MSHLRSLRLLGAALAALAASPAPPAAAQAPAAVAVDSARLLADLRALAADSMEGRRAGTPGGERARRFVAAALREAGVTPFGDDLARPFALAGEDGGAGTAVNLVGFVRGTRRPDRYLVVTAHYDHVGVRDGEVFNGADDNASGVAALLALARHLAASPPEHSVVLAALDAEEGGLRGARAFLADPPVAREAIELNVNLDMVGRNERGELYAAGTHHYPFLRPHLERVAARAPVSLRFGHDSPDLGSDDWTSQSDHGVFHAAGIPFVYFGVEDHPDYHRPTDDAERIEPAFFVNAARTVILAVEELDRALGR